jgi:hypothetical protein
MAPKDTPRFVVFARKLTLVSSLALPLAGCGEDRAPSKQNTSVVDSGDTSPPFPPPGVKPLPQDAPDATGDAANVDSQAEVADDAEQQPQRCGPFLGVIAIPPHDADVAEVSPPPGLRPMVDAGTCDGGVVPAGGPLAPPEFLA